MLCIILCLLNSCIFCIVADLGWFFLCGSYWAHGILYWRWNFWCLSKLESTKGYSPCTSWHKRICRKTTSWHYIGNIIVTCNFCCNKIKFIYVIIAIVNIVIIDLYSFINIKRVWVVKSLWLDYCTTWLGFNFCCEKNLVFLWSFSHHKMVTN